jgi:hypothetical protein
VSGRVISQLYHGENKLNMIMIINMQNNEKKVLNSDGQQFHQYQQNEQSPLTLTH